MLKQIVVLAVVFSASAVSIAKTTSMPAPSSSESQSIDQNSERLYHAIAQHEVAREYFFIITGAVFTLFLGLMFAGWWKIRSIISGAVKRMELEIKKLREDSFNEIQKNSKNTEGVIVKIKEDMKQIEDSHILRTIALESEIYRTMALSLLGLQNYSSAFLWFMRTAQNSQKAGSPSFVKMMINKALSTLKKIPDNKKEPMGNEYIDEVKEILKNIKSDETKDSCESIKKEMNLRIDGFDSEPEG